MHFTMVQLEEKSHSASSLVPTSAIVNLPAVRPAGTVVGEVLVRPGDGLNSWMAILIGDDVVRRQGIPGMPLGSGGLTPNQVTTILNWINRGAPDD